MTNNILTLKEVKTQNLPRYTYHGGIYKYQDTKDGYCRLIIGGVDVLEGKKAVGGYCYTREVYKYQTKDGESHDLIGFNVMDLEFYKQLTS